MAKPSPPSGTIGCNWKFELPATGCTRGGIVREKVGFQVGKSPRILNGRALVPDVRFSGFIPILEMQRMIAFGDVLDAVFLNGNGGLLERVGEKTAFMNGVETGDGIGVFDDVANAHILLVDHRGQGTVVKMAVHAGFPLEGFDFMAVEVVDDVATTVQPHHVELEGLVSGIIICIDITHALNTVAIGDADGVMPERLLQRNVPLVFNEQVMKSPQESCRIHGHSFGQRLKHGPLRDGASGGIL